MDGGSAHERLIGVWRLERVESTGPDGLHLPYGEKPVGRLTYDSAGRMSAFVMRAGRTPVGANRLQDAAPGELRDLVSGFVAYCGTFEVDEAACAVTHYVELALHPGWVGTQLRRTYEFSGDSVTLTAVTAPGTTARLVWRREPQ
jgi:hypothetical protein